MSKGTTPKRLSTVDKNTFGTLYRIRLIRGGHKSTDLAGIVLQTLSEHLFSWYIVIKCLVLPIQDGQPCLKNLPLKNSQFAPSAIFWPDDMRLQIRKRIGIRTLFYQLQIR